MVLIDRSEAERALLAQEKLTPSVIRRVLRMLPDAVVRCKECIHWYDREEVCLKIYSDGAVHESCWLTRKPDDFCSYGKRREENAAD